jgi:hypothetical protein
MSGLSQVTGRIILDIRDGKLSILPVADSDTEFAALIRALREFIVTGDLLALLDGMNPGKAGL